MAFTIFSNISDIRALYILRTRLALLVLGIVVFSGCATEAPIPVDSEIANKPIYNNKAAYNRPYKVKGKTYYPLVSGVGYRKRGMASWYGAESGKQTAMGDRFNPSQFTAAHKTLPLPCKVRVTNLSNGRSIDVLVNDRGPFHGNRLIDLSHAAAKQLGLKGLIEVEIEYLSG